jgi:hypothetical protein
VAPSIAYTCRESLARTVGALYASVVLDAERAGAVRLQSRSSFSDARGEAPFGEASYQTAVSSASVSGWRRSQMSRPVSSPLWLPSSDAPWRAASPSARSPTPVDGPPPDGSSVPGDVGPERAP